MALTGTITMFNVKDGDAILVHLHKPGDDLVMVIDCGRAADFDAHMRDPLEEVLTKTKKDGPDIVVATHYDSDHIAGLLKLAEKYKGRIGELWAHSPPASFDRHVKGLMEGKPLRNLESWGEFSTNALLEANKDVTPEAFEKAGAILMESLPELRKLQNIYPKDTKAVFRGYRVKGWEDEIKVLGPTETYYDSLFGSARSYEAILLDEARGLMAMRPNGPAEAVNERLISHGRPCDLVKRDGSPSITATNRASIIMAINAAEGRYLFTGDAGIHSFKAIPDWQRELEDLYWLKIPHHGSANNTTWETKDVMKPMYADCSGGDQHQDDYVVKCIGENPRSKRDARSTKWSGDLQFSIGSNEVGH